MLHKTLDSYHRGEPWKEEGAHPDGPLWLIRPEEYNRLPDGVLIEQADTGIMYRKHYEKIETRTPFEREHGYMCWGLRGYKDD